MNLKGWLLATRPVTLIASLIPILVSGAYLSTRVQGRLTAGFFFHGVLLLVACISMQVACNFTNDYYDYLRGTDDESRRGPRRMLQQGKVSLPAMRRAMMVTYGLALWIGITFGVRFQANHPTFSIIVIVFTLLSVFISYAYTGGRYPLGYHGLGDGAAFVFFGPGLVVMLVAIWGLSVESFIDLGSFSLHPSVYITDAVLFGLPLGFFSLVLININNLRDLEEDQQKNKNTLAVLLSKQFGRRVVERLFIVYLFLAIISPSFYLLQRVNLSNLFLIVAQVLFSCFFLYQLKDLPSVVRKNNAEEMNSGLKKIGKVYLFCGVVQAIIICFYL